MNVNSKPRGIGLFASQRSRSAKPLYQWQLRVSAVLLLACSVILSAAEPKAAVVIVPVANMYSKASEESDVVSQAIYGSNVAVLEETSGWARVRTPDQYSGWMPASALRKVNGDSAHSRVVQVESLFANLYRETDVTEHQPALTVPFESRLEVVAEGTGDDTGWLKVRLLDGRDAWIQSSDVVADPKPLTIEQSIALGKRFLGLPYLWGGRSSYGYDCSGSHR